ncbi:MAG TPA: ATP-binding protein [Oligoflexia bacterium]|nr:ATP-binding protein [Oligoflexia bacterium]HMR24511.1 ATP-binding protein [Oligoflexia bacterium]
MPKVLTNLFVVLFVFLNTCIAFGEPIYVNFQYSFNESKNFILEDSDQNDWKKYVPNQHFKHPNKDEYKYWIKFDLYLDSLNYKDPSIYLGLIGDVDEVYINGKFVGSTGKIDGRSPSYFHVPRLYRVSKEYLKKRNTVYIKAKKQSIVNAGIHLGKVQFGEYGELISKKRNAQFFIFDLNVILAFFSFFIGVYHLYLYYRIPTKHQNLIYFVFSTFSSLFILSLGLFFGNYIESSWWVVIIHSLLGIFTAVTYFIFTQKFLNLDYKLFHKIFIALNILFAAIIVLEPRFSRAFAYYNIWYLVGLLTIAYGGLNIFKRYYYEKRNDLFVMLLSILGLFLIVIVDILSTIGIFSFYQITGVGFFLLNVGVLVALAYDFTDAYVNIENLVEDRTKDLSVAVERLKDLEEMKDKFFANISHDFKTPIAVAMGSLEEIKRETLPTETVQRRAVIAAESSLNKLLAMVGDLLDVIKAESGALKMEWTSVNPVEILKEWMQPFLVLANKKSLKLNIKNDVKEDIKIPLDVNKFERVIQNLLSNALKFTNYAKNKENLIEIQLRSDKAWYYIEVHDSGMGIPDDEKPMVFERYYQTTKTSLKHHGGSGIGLSFVKEMIENHNGTITVKDSDYGGVKFVIALPLKQNVEVTGNYFVGSDSNEHEVYSVEFPRRAPEKINESLFTILIAEDNPEVANITLAAVEKEFNVYMVENGQEAFDFIQNNTIDCLVTDIVMPVMRGEELVKKVRAYNKTKDLPILVLSSQSDENTVVELLKEGANDYVTKPFKREVLLARVYGQIEKHKSSQWIAQNEKVIELGMLASGIAHQIRNGLHAMKNQISYYEKTAQRIEQNIHELSAEQRLKIKERLDQCNAMMMRALNRIDSLTSSVNSYALGSKQVIEITLKDSLTLMKELLADKIKSSAVTIELDIQDNLKFFGYSSFHEVIINLFVNAIDACKHDGTGKIILKAKENREKVKIEIEDNGSGINKDTLDRIWQPFFTTKDPDKGTGLGLYIVRDIIQGQHGGKLNVYSEGEGKGAKFVIEIPKVAKEATQDASFVMHGHEV